MIHGATRSKSHAAGQNVTCYGRKGTTHKLLTSGSMPAEGLSWLIRWDDAPDAEPSQVHEYHLRFVTAHPAQAGGAS